MVRYFINLFFIALILGCNPYPKYALVPEIDSSQASLVVASMLGLAVQMGDNLTVNAGTDLKKPNRSGWDSYFVKSAYADVPNSPALIYCSYPSFSACSGGTTNFSSGTCTRTNLILQSLTESLVTDGPPPKGSKVTTPVAQCPSPGNWSTVFATNTMTVSRTLEYTATTPLGNSITANTSGLAGWDSTISLNATGGILYTNTSANAAGGTLTVLGIEYNFSLANTPTGTSAAISSFFRPLFADIAPLPTKTTTAATPSVSSPTASSSTWSDTVTSGPINVTLGGTGSTLITLNSSGSNELIRVQQNNARFTSSSILTGVTFDHSSNGCGCFPTAGVISTSYTGSKTGYETLSFNRTTCGSYTLQQTNSAGNPIAAPVKSVLEFCL